MEAIKHISSILSSNIPDQQVYKINVSFAALYSDQLIRLLGRVWDAIFES